MSQYIASKLFYCRKILFRVSETAITLLLLLASCRNKILFLGIPCYLRPAEKNGIRKRQMKTPVFLNCELHWKNMLLVTIYCDQISRYSEVTKFSWNCKISFWKNSLNFIPVLHTNWGKEMFYYSFLTLSLSLSFSLARSLSLELCLYMYIHLHT